MELSENWGKQQSQMIPQESKDRVFSLLKKFFYLLETIDIVSVEISQHLVPTKIDILEHFRVLTRGEVDSEQCQVNVITSFS